MRKFLSTIAVSGLLLGAAAITAPAATAAPIDCPGGQTATKVDGGWDCVNRGGNGSNAEDPKNPNKGKGDF